MATPPPYADRVRGEGDDTVGRFGVLLLVLAGSVREHGYKVVLTMPVENNG